MSAPVYPPMPQQRFESFQPGIIPASNYGAGFIPSPNLYLGYQPQFPFGGYGAGFIPSPVPWYGYGIGASLSFLF